ncbi:MAG: ADOP family duplicated permease [Terriglobia bacterium]
MPEWKHEITKRLSGLKLEPAREAEIVEELSQHLEDRYQELLVSGIPAETAYRTALEELTGTNLLAEELQRVEHPVTQQPVVLGGGSRKNFLADLWQDLRYGLRQLRRNPGFTAVAIITLALGIGATTAIFSMVNGILLRALPYHQPQRLYVVREVVPQWNQYGPWVAVNGGNFLMWRRDCHAFSAYAALESVTDDLTGTGRPQQVHGARVSADFFSMLGIEPQIGRTFLAEEDKQGRNHVAILTHQLWQNTFHADPKIIGKGITLGGTPYTVVGVLPASFRFPKLLAQTPQFFRPLGLSQQESQPGNGMHNLTVVARLKPGITQQQALAQLDVIETQIAKRDSSGFGLEAMLVPLKTVIVGTAQQALWMLIVAALFVLLIVCVNLANLLLVKNAARVHEVAVRTALGATPRRLTRQLLTEALILAAAGGALGLLFAYGGLELLVRHAPLGIPRLHEVQIDPRVLWFTLGISVVAGLLFAVLPTLRLARVEPVEALKSAGPTVSGIKQGARLRGILVSSEVALCAVLLVGALLLAKSLMRVFSANAWLEEQRVLAVDVIAPPNESRTPAQRDKFFSTVLEKVSALPGVRSAGFTSKLPLMGDDWGNLIQFREAPQPVKERAMGEFRFVSPGYFKAIGMPLVKGRMFSVDDRGKDVAIISESVAQRVLPDRDPIGMHIEGSPSGPWCEVVGVVKDFRTGPDKPPALAVYVPLWEFSRREEALVVRTGMDPRGAATAIRRAIWSINPQVAIPREETLKTIVESSVAPRRFETLLGALFALCAVLLAALGLYGVISYSVSQRTHEIGIRMALGAQRSDVLKMVVRQGFILALIGVGAGLIAALGLTRFLQSLLFGVGPTDLETFVVVACVLVGVALLACYIPARRATKVDPMVALRYE